MRANRTIVWETLIDKHSLGHPMRCGGVTERFTSIRGHLGLGNAVSLVNVGRKLCVEKKFAIHLTSSVDIFNIICLRIVHLIITIIHHLFSATM